MEVNMSSWGSYPSIYAMGHRAIKDLLSVDVNVEEKVDGSQFSFGVFPTDESDPGTTFYVGDNLNLRIRSKGAVMHPEAPEKMFSLGAKEVREMAVNLHPGWTYRGEYLAKPKHNSLMYDRVPAHNIIIFDINTGHQEFLSYEHKAEECANLGLEVVPLIFSGKIDSVETFRNFLARVSILGGQNIEGVVVKPREYNLYGLDKKVLFGKFVSEAFKEVHRKAWAESNPTNKDIIQKIKDQYGTPARWNKAIQHLREAGQLQDDPKDIGPLMKEIPQDVLKECEDEIKELLFKYAWPHVRRGLTAGFPEFYKDLLLRRSFETNEGQELGPRESLEDVGNGSGNSDSSPAGNPPVVEV